MSDDPDLSRAFAALDRPPLPDALRQTLVAIPQRQRQFRWWLAAIPTALAAGLLLVWGLPSERTTPAAPLPTTLARREAPQPMQAGEAPLMPSAPAPASAAPLRSRDVAPGANRAQPAEAAVADTDETAAAFAQLAESARANQAAGLAAPEAQAEMPRPLTAVLSRDALPGRLSLRLTNATVSDWALSDEELVLAGIDGAGSVLWTRPFLIGTTPRAGIYVVPAGGELVLSAPSAEAPGLFVLAGPISTLPLLSE